MADYSQTVFFGPKDSLTPGDPNKIVKGTEIDGEYSAISTAIASKVDTSGNGVTVTGKVVDLDLAGLSVDTIVGADVIGFADVSDSNTAKQVTLSNVSVAQSGDGVAVDGSGQQFVDIDGTTEQAAIDGANDYLLMYDTSEAALRKVAIDDAFSGAGGSVPNTRTLTAGEGLSGGGDLSADRTFDIDIDGLASTTDPDIDNDYLVIYDDSAAGHRKVAVGEVGGGALTVTTSASGKTLTLADANTVIGFTGSLNSTFVVPQDATTNFDIGTIIVIAHQDNTSTYFNVETDNAACEITGYAGTASTFGEFLCWGGGSCVLIKLAANRWHITGDVSQ